MYGDQKLATGAAEDALAKYDEALASQSALKGSFSCMEFDVIISTYNPTFGQEFKLKERLSCGRLLCSFRSPLGSFVPS
jgi:hypothetical protein